MSPTDIQIIFGGVLAIFLIILVYLAGRRRGARSKKVKKPGKVSQPSEKPTGLTGKTFSSTIAGVTFDTSSGQNRQAFIKKELNVGDHLLFRHEPENKYDSDAIAIYTRNGFHLGYVKSGIFYGADGESLIIKNIKAGIKIKGKVKDIYSTSDEVLGVSYDIYL